MSATWRKMLVVLCAMTMMFQCVSLPALAEEIESVISEPSGIQEESPAETGLSSDENIPEEEQQTEETEVNAENLPDESADDEGNAEEAEAAADEQALFPEKEEDTEVLTENPAEETEPETTTEEPPAEEPASETEPEIPAAETAAVESADYSETETTTFETPAVEPEPEASAALAPDAEDETAGEAEPDADADKTPAEFQPAEAPDEWQEEPSDTSERAEVSASGQQEQPTEEDGGEPQETDPETADLEPAEEEPEEVGEDAFPSTEIIITKTIRPGEYWTGKVTDSQTALLKLDVSQSGKLYLIVEGTETVWAIVVKSDRPESSPERTLTDPETAFLVAAWNAEQGSYLIEIGPESQDTAAMITVRILDGEDYAAWEEAQQNTEDQPKPEEQEETAEQKTEEKIETDKQTEIGEQPVTDEQEETAEQPSAEDPSGTEEKQPVTAESGEGTELNEEMTDTVQPEKRSIHVDLIWSTEDPQIGDVAHFTSVLTGYDNLPYTLQWQTSWDGETWTDYPGATQPQMYVALTEEMNGIFFRLVVYVESEQEEA